MTTEELLQQALQRRALLAELLQQATPRDAGSLSRELRLLDVHILKLQDKAAAQRQVSPDEEELRAMLDEPPPQPTWPDRPFAG